MIYLINQFYGIGEHLKYDLGEHLIEQGHHIKVITGNNGDESLPPHEKNVNKEIFRINTPRLTRTFWGRIKSYLGFCSGTLKHIIKIETGSTVVVTTQPFFVAFLVALFKNQKRLKVIYNVQDLYPEILHALGKSGEKSILTKIIGRIQNYTLNRSDVVVAIGFSMKKKIVENYKLPLEKVLVIENWGQSDKEAKLLQRPLTNNAIRILYTGNMGESHEIDTLWGTFQMIKQEGLSEIFQFRIIGIGSNYQKLKSLCLTHDFSFVEFAEPITSEKLMFEYANADLALVISNWEIEGILVPSKFYSVATSCPVIFIGSQNDTPSQHILKGNFGYVIQNGNSKRLFEILVDLIPNRNKLIDLRTNAYLYYQKFLHSSLRLKEWEEVLSRFEKNETKTEVTEVFQ